MPRFRPENPGSRPAQRGVAVPSAQPAPPTPTPSTGRHPPWTLFADNAGSRDELPRRARKVGVDDLSEPRTDSLASMPTNRGGNVCGGFSWTGKQATRSPSSSDDVDEDRSSRIGRGPLPAQGGLSTPDTKSAMGARCPPGKASVRTSLSALRLATRVITRFASFLTRLTDLPYITAEYGSVDAWKPLVRGEHP